MVWIDILNFQVISLCFYCYKAMLQRTFLYLDLEILCLFPPNSSLGLAQGFQIICKKVTWD